jgi:hypothetical protein
VVAVPVDLLAHASADQWEERVRDGDRRAQQVDDLDGCQRGAEQLALEVTVPRDHGHRAVVRRLALARAHVHDDPAHPPLVPGPREQPPPGARARRPAPSIMASSHTGNCASHSCAMSCSSRIAVIGSALAGSSAPARRTAAPPPRQQEVRRTQQETPAEHVRAVAADPSRDEVVALAQLPLAAANPCGGVARGAEGNEQGTPTSRGGRMPRGTSEVINDHLRLRRAGRAAEDLERNYAEDVVVLSHIGQFRGLDAMRLLAGLLDEQFVDARYHYEMVLFDGEFAFLRWRAEAQDLHGDGADTFCVRDGRIVAQSIYYSVATNSERGGQLQDA